MKQSFTLTALLLIILISICSCNSQQRYQKNSTTSFYRKINKEKAAENHLVASRVNWDMTGGISLQDQQAMMVEKTDNYAAQRAYMNQVRSKSDPFKVIYDDSEFANGDVYIQAAQRRKELANKMKLGCENCTSSTTKKEENTK